VGGYIAGSNIPTHNKLLLEISFPLFYFNNKKANDIIEKHIHLNAFTASLPS